MRLINESQRNIYAESDHRRSADFLSRYKSILDTASLKQDIKILDLGGASGHFALSLKQHFADINVEVYVLDPVRYDSWEEDALGKEIHFICDSVENLESLFAKNTFDFVFANRVFHHFIESSWKKTIQHMKKHMITLHKLLKADGCLCILDHFYNGSVWDSSSSYLIYRLTSIRNPFLSKIIGKLGAQTAGIGVCFLSETMWRKLIKSSSFKIIDTHISEYRKLSIPRRIFLLSKEVSHDSIIIATPE